MRHALPGLLTESPRVETLICIHRDAVEMVYLKSYSVHGSKASYANPDLDAKITEVKSTIKSQLNNMLVEVSLLSVCT